jgi:teichuronic acid biosynthesis glycosyltransferase TuaH
MGTPVLSHQRNESQSRPLVVWSAGVSWGAVAGTDRHMATAMRQYADILWVDPPVSPVTPARFAGGNTHSPWPTLRGLTANMGRLTPKALPFHSRPVVRLTTWPLVRIQIRWALRKLGRRPYAVVGSHLDDVLGGWGDDVANVLYGTDDFVAGAALMGLDHRRLALEERNRLTKADIAIAVSEDLASRWKALYYTGRIVVIPNGVDVDAYHACTDSSDFPVVDLPRPIAGLIGHLSSRIDIELLTSIVSAGCSLLLVGPVDSSWEPERFAKLIALPNVRWVGPVPFERLPAYLSVMDVGVTPYVESPFNLASFPLKTLEYLAAGKPVVSTDLPAVKWLDTDLVSVADRTTFGTATLAAASQSRVDALILRRVAFAKHHSWTNRAAEFANAIGLTKMAR